MRTKFRLLVGVASVLLVVAGVGRLWLAPWSICRQNQSLAEQALIRGDYELARRHLTQCLLARPQSAQQHLAMARACRLGDDFAAWKHHLAEARKLGCSSEPLKREENLCQVQSGVFGKIEDELQESLAARGPDEDQIFEALVRGYLRGYRLKDVVRAANLWVERYPDDWRPYWYRGQAFERHGVVPEAVPEYRAVLRLQPEHWHARLTLAAILFDQCQFVEALEQFDQVLQQVPNNTVALYGTACCHRSRGSTEAALAALQKLFAQQPEHPAGLLLRGKLEMDQCHPDAAMTWLRRAYALNPRSFNVNATLASCLRLLGESQRAANFEQAGEDLRKKHRRLTTVIQQLGAKPLDVGLRLEAGELCRGLGQESDALRWFVSAVQADPQHLQARKSLADYMRQARSNGSRQNRELLASGS